MIYNLLKSVSDMVIVSTQRMHSGAIQHQQSSRLVKNHLTYITDQMNRDDMD